MKKDALARPDRPLVDDGTRAIGKRCAVKLGLKKEDYSVISLRKGCVSSAMAAKVSDRIIQEHGRWLSVAGPIPYGHVGIEGGLELSRALYDGLQPQA